MGVKLQMCVCEWVNVFKKHVVIGEWVWVNVCEPVNVDERL